MSVLLQEVLFPPKPYLLCGVSKMSRGGSEPCIVTFMGPVGVGKSTHIGLLKDHLKLRNVKVVTTFIKSTHGLTYVIYKTLMALGVHEEFPYPAGFTRKHPRRNILKKLFSLWCFLDSLNIAVKFFFVVYIPFRFGFTVIIEEGLIMTLYTYTMSFPQFFDTEPRVLPLLPSLLGWVTSKNHVDIVLNASIEELDRRRRHRRYRQDELPEYVAMQRKWIQRLKYDDAFFVETTEEPVIKAHRNIIAELEKRLCIKK